MWGGEGGGGRRAGLHVVCVSSCERVLSVRACMVCDDARAHVTAAPLPPHPKKKHPPPKQAGLFGYFPTYSLGAMYATQIYQAAARQLPSLDADVAAGRFGALKGWLNEKVHRSGSLHPSGDALMEAVTGAPLDPSIFLAYLRAKYAPLYKL